MIFVYGDYVDVLSAANNDFANACKYFSERHNDFDANKVWVDIAE